MQLIRLQLIRRVQILVDIYHDTQFMRRIQPLFYANKLCVLVNARIIIKYQLYMTKCYNKSYYLYAMLHTYYARVTQIGNSKGVRLPKELALSLGTTEIILEQTNEGILIKPAHKIPPLAEWANLFAKADTSLEEEFKDWDITLNDGFTADEDV